MHAMAATFSNRFPIVFSLIFYFCALKIQLCAQFNGEELPLKNRFVNRNACVVPFVINACVAIHNEIYIQENTRLKIKCLNNKIERFAKKNSSLEFTKIEPLDDNIGNLKGTYLK